MNIDFKERGLLKILAESRIMAETGADTLPVMDPQRLHLLKKGKNLAFLNETLVACGMCATRGGKGLT